jgi:hypothetical protein
MNYKGTTTHPHPTTFFSAVGPRSEHWPTAPQILNPPLSLMIPFHEYCCHFSCPTLHNLRNNGL